MRDEKAVMTASARSENTARNASRTTAYRSL